MASRSQSIQPHNVQHGTDVLKWVKLSLISFALVALVGVMMRIKIGWSFPWLDQKQLQHAHSHFAFAGWITQTLLLLIATRVWPGQPEADQRKMRRILLYNWICAAGMLIAFAMQGYGAVSISCSTLSIVVFLWAAVYLFRWMRLATPHPAFGWLRAALWFGLLSTVGTAALSYMMASHQITQHNYLAAVYWYLHFQYNGWFFFGGMALFSWWLTDLTTIPPIPALARHLLVWSCLPAFGLSVLWMHIPLPLYLLVIIASIAQVAGWGLILIHVHKYRFFSQLPAQKMLKLLLICISIAVSIKLLLQLASVIPAVSKLAFGFRPIVVAYLHLVLLAIISLFLMTYLYGKQLLCQHKMVPKALLLLLAGIGINELTLGIQGIASLQYIAIPFTKELLLFASLLMLCAIVWLVVMQCQKSSATQQYL
ncbi:MAG: hypothetical protein E6Q39_00350 [Crocinitomicaceae bacterium]|nr:MAG: hypothetical protein E6Q39_00350 [Crocinitomicaceae bacterium]